MKCVGKYSIFGSSNKHIISTHFTVYLHPHIFRCIIVMQEAELNYHAQLARIRPAVTAEFLCSKMH